SPEKFGTSVAGGQTTKSIWRGSLTASWVILRSSLLDLRRPFIFQLPATSGRRSGFAIVVPFCDGRGARQPSRYQTKMAGARASVGGARRVAAGRASCG